MKECKLINESLNSLESQMPQPNHVNVFELVIKYLDLKSKVKCELVCSQWRDIAKDELAVYQNVISSWKGQDIPFEHDQYKPSQHNYVGDLLNTKDYDKFKLLLSKFSNLKCLYIEKDISDWKYFKTLVTYCPKIEHIFIRCTNNFVGYKLQHNIFSESQFRWRLRRDIDVSIRRKIMDVGNLLGKLKIKSFGFDHQHLITNYDDAFTMLTSQMKHLENVYITFLKKVNQYFLSKHNNIKQIVICNPYVRSYNCSDLVDCICGKQQIKPQFEKFDVRINGITIDDYSLILSKFPNLNELTIYQLNSQCFEQLKQLIAESNIKKLNYRNLLLNNILFSTQMKSIEEMTFYDPVFSITSLNLFNISFYCKNLKRLSLNGFVSAEIGNHKSFKMMMEEISKLNNLQYFQMCFTKFVGKKEYFNYQISNDIFTSFKCPKSLNTMKFTGMEMNLNEKQLIDDWFNYVKSQPKIWFIFVLKEKSSYLNTKIMPNNFKINLI